jgi:hypothetical protein
LDLDVRLSEERELGEPKSKYETFLLLHLPSGPDPVQIQIQRPNNFSHQKYYCTYHVHYKTRTLADNEIFFLDTFLQASMP